MMNTDDILQASEEKRLKMLKIMLNCCDMVPPWYIPNYNHIPPSNDPIAITSYTFLSLALINRIEQLEEELTKNGINVPEWKELLNNG